VNRQRHFAADHARQGLEVDMRAVARWHMLGRNERDEPEVQ